VLTVVQRGNKCPKITREENENMWRINGKLRVRVT